MGIAPLTFLANRLEQQGQNVILLFGQKQRDRALERQALPRLTRPGSRVRLASEQQRQGCFQGLVTQLAAKLLADGKGLPGTIPVYACGPWAFYRSLQGTLRQYRHPCQVSLEGSLACGFGACLGCAVKQNGKPGYLKICSDGPVFDINDIDFSVRN
jgi:dihydroorotate dehydrogenase electron transfer subunit